MQVARRMMNGNGNYSNSHHHRCNEKFVNGFVGRSSSDGFAMIPVSSSSSPTSSHANYIEHRVSKMDTLAGVAIKYGVEVADIKRMNGLVTDLQMFAHKSLQIPLPGRHPPSPVMSNGSANNGEHTPLNQPRDDVLDSLQSFKLKPPRRVSPAMSTLQGYYGLTPPKKSPVVEGSPMTVYKNGRTLYFDDESLPRVSPVSDVQLSLHRKSRSLVSLQNGEMVSEDKSVAEAGENSDTERSIRRRQKADADHYIRTPEILMKEDNGGFSGRTGKGLALRPKVGSRTDMDASRPHPFPACDSLICDASFSVRKSSSTSNLQESESVSSSIWPTGKWTLKPDAIARPIFDGLPKPINGRRNKAALD